MTHVIDVIHHHGHLLRQAHHGMQRAARLREAGEIERAEVEEDEATEHRQIAASLARLLQEAGHDVYVPVPGQLALLSDGVSA